MIRLELWNGAAGDREKKVLREFEKTLPELEMDGEVWRTAYELARRSRALGVTVPATGLLIATCAAHVEPSVRGRLGAASMEIEPIVSVR